MVKNKKEKVQNRRYITSGTIFSLTTFLYMPKGDSEIRLVYDLTTCGLNEVLWDPKLCIFSVENVLET